MGLSEDHCLPPLLPMFEYLFASCMGCCVPTRVSAEFDQSGKLLIPGSEGLKAELRREGAGRVKVVIRRAGRQLTWQDALVGLSAESPAFRELMSKTMQELPFDAFFWECAPVSVATCGRRLFEFVALHAPTLELAAADGRAFAEHLDPYNGAKGK